MAFAIPRRNIVPARVWPALTSSYGETVTLDELSVEDLDRAEQACSYSSLSFAIPEELPGLLAAQAPDLAARLRGLAEDELDVLLDYLRDCRERAGAPALTA